MRYTADIISSCLRIFDDSQLFLKAPVLSNQYPTDLDSILKIVEQQNEMLEPLPSYTFSNWCIYIIPAHISCHIYIFSVMGAADLTQIQKIRPSCPADI